MGVYRERMENDLQIRGYSKDTTKVYLACVKSFVGHFMEPPNKLGLEHIKEYQLYLTKERKVCWATFNQTVCALRFFYDVTLGKDWDIKHIPYQKTGRKLPVVLSAEEIQSLLKAVNNIKHQAILATCYAGGLRRMEVVQLRVPDIDSGRMVLRIENGKGKKDRYVPLSERLLGLLRHYWKEYRPPDWLFEGEDPGKHLDRGTVSRIFRDARRAAGIRKPATAHSLRHSYATHLLENGVNLRVIQKLLGHRSVRSTEIYTHVARNYLSETPSPLDLMPDPEALRSVDDH
jgi:integrase/recombinase XerD